MIQLTNRILITAIKHKTKAKMFENVEKGDILWLSLDLVATGRSRRAAYVPTIHIRNLSKAESAYKSLNETAALLNDVFEYEEF